MAGSPTFRRPAQPLVFPVRAEHREEFRALLAYSHSLGIAPAWVFCSPTPRWAACIWTTCALLAKPLGITEVLPLVVGSQVSDEQLDAYVKQLRERRIEFMFNPRLDRRLRKADPPCTCLPGVTTTFQGVNSGSTALARHLGELAAGMLFTPGGAQPLGAQERTDTRLPDRLPQRLQGPGLFIRQPGRLCDLARAGRSLAQDRAAT